MWRHPRRHGTLRRSDERCKAPKTGERALANLPKRHDSEANTFLKLNIYLCEEILKLDPLYAISEARMRRIVIHGVKASDIITATRGWAKEPTFTGWRISWPIKRLYTNICLKPPWMMNKLFSGLFLLISIFLKKILVKLFF